MSLLHWLLPQYCALCAQAKPYQYGVCSQCLQDFLPVSTNRCPVCALPAVNGFDHADLKCGSCQSHNPAYDTIITPFYYQQPASYLVTSFKFHNQLHLAKSLSQMIADQVREDYQQTPLPELIIPVPLHHQRRHSRGFNQAALLAKRLSCQLNIPLDRRAIKRISATKAQHTLPEKKRQQNVRRAFAVHRHVEVNHVAILDDVVTTGATAHELSALLKSSGIKRVDVWCCARTLKIS